MGFEVHYEEKVTYLLSLECMQVLDPHVIIRIWADLSSKLISKAHMIRSWMYIFQA